MGFRPNIPNGKVTHVKVLVSNGDQNAEVLMPIEEFAALFSYYGEFGEAPIRAASADQMAYRASQRQGKAE